MILPTALRVFAIVLTVGLAIPACSGKGDPQTAGSSLAPTAKKTLATVVSVRVRKGLVQEHLKTLGSVDFDPQRTRALPFVRSGQVLRLRVTQGQSVSKGSTLLRLGPLPSASPRVRSARLALSVARQEVARIQRLKASGLATAGDLQRGAAALARAQATLRGLGDGHASRLTAPFDGIVAKVLIKAGDIVQPGQGALILAPQAGIAVRCGFEPEDAARLTPKLRVFISPVFGRGDETPAQAKLARLHRAVDPVTQLVSALLRPEKVPGWMVAGLAVHVRVEVHSQQGSLRVPREALLHREGKLGVFAVASGVARFRPIKVGLENDRWVEVTQGLEEGNRVVTTGRSSLKDGMAIAPSQRTPTNAPPRSTAAKAQAHP